MALIDIYLSRILFKNNLFANSTAYNIHVKLWPYSAKELRIFFRKVELLNTTHALLSDT